MPVERNYDVGNRELLAVKLVLEEWRHWLDGALHPLIIFTDHKNLEYLRTTKRLNSCQARWALFFTRFQFTVCFRPGSKNAEMARDMSDKDIMKMELEQLQKEVNTPRTAMSTTAPELVSFIEAQSAEDPLIKGVPEDKNPFKEKGGCVIT
ncbi:hypothetical protein PGIGA_G00033340 [Pangasianodon gigas]|uniref:Uncharacterized protein n=1 Tax=Pangasianodon gigas TaxID=30993 RepID=A0ACC5WZ04_PANGG|nr:hypothetical protein [Pangasianodon gigas]